MPCFAMLMPSLIRQAQKINVNGITTNERIQTTSSPKLHHGSFFLFYDQNKQEKERTIELGNVWKHQKETTVTCILDAALPPRPAPAAYLRPRSNKVLDVGNAAVESCCGYRNFGRLQSLQ